MVGLVEVHFTLKQHIKVFVRVILAQEFRSKLDYDIFTKEIEELLKNIGQPDGVTYDAALFPWEDSLWIDRRIDVNGYSDGV